MWIDVHNVEIEYHGTHAPLSERLDRLCSGHAKGGAALCYVAFRPGSKFGMLGLQFHDDSFFY